MMSNDFRKEIQYFSFPSIFSSYLGFSSEIFSYTRFFSSSSYVAFPAMQCVYVSWKNSDKQAIWMLGGINVRVETWSMWSSSSLISPLSYITHFFLNIIFSTSEGCSVLCTRWTAMWHSKSWEVLELAWTHELCRRTSSSSSWSPSDSTICARFYETVEKLIHIFWKIL